MSSATPENRQIGNYRLLEWLGGGYFADVYLAEHIYLDRQVAVKVLRTHLTNQEYIDLFRQEARTIAKLEHPNIVQVTDFDIVNGTPFLVMRCAPSSLRKLHPKGIRLPLTKIVTYVTQIASALQYAHDAGIVHRDVKPENMLLGQNNEALLSDFGIATVTDSYRHSQQDAAGTLVYMAPEQIQGFPRRASDQYSLGIVIYEWLCGKPPFTEGNFIQLSYQHIHVPPPPLREKVPAIPLLVEEVVLKALEKESDKRFPSVTAFAKALEEAWALPGEHHYPIEVADAMRECYYKWLGKADWDEMKEVGLDDAKELQHNYRVGGETKVTKGYKRPFTRGAIYWSDRVGAQPIWGGINQLHEKRGGVQGLMGFPLSAELPAHDSQKGTTGVVQHFEGRWSYPEDIFSTDARYGLSAYYSNEYGVYLVDGEIGVCYERLGGTSGKLGFPTSHAHQVKSLRDTEGWNKEFEGGRIYWSQRAHAHPVWGKIGERYHNLGGAKGRLGYPLTDEKDAESPQGTKGKVQRFEGGPKDRWPVGDDKWEYDDTKGVCIYYSAKYGAHQVWGGIMICYERLEGIKSPLGFPISAERDATESPQRTTGWYQPFEGGSIHWCEKYSGVAVTGRIFEVFMRFGGSGGKFGFPMSSQVSVKGHEDMCQQEFEGGVICVVHK